MLSCDCTTLEEKLQPNPKKLSVGGVEGDDADGSQGSSKECSLRPHRVKAGSRLESILVEEDKGWRMKTPLWNMRRNPWLVVKVVRSAEIILCLVSAVRASPAIILL